MTNGEVLVRIACFMFGALVLALGYVLGYVSGLRAGRWGVVEEAVMEGGVIVLEKRKAPEAKSEEETKCSE